MQTSSFHQEINSKKRVVAMANLNIFKRVTGAGALLAAIVALVGLGVWLSQPEPGTLPSLSLLHGQGVPLPGSP